MTVIAEVIKEEKKCVDEILRLLGSVLKNSLNTESREIIKLVIMLLCKKPTKYADQIKKLAEVLAHSLASGDKEWIKEFVPAHIYKLPD